MLHRALAYLGRPEVRARPLLLLWRRLVFVLARGRGERRVRFDGASRMSLRLDDVVERAIFLYGVHEYRAAAAFCTLVRPGATVVDAGAHVGQYTLLAASRAGDTGRVLAFEPFAENRRRLERNVELSGWQNVEILPYALAAADGTLALERAQPGNSGMIRARRDGSGEKVEARSLDSILGERGIDRIDVLKIDVEGLEAEVLDGAAATIARGRPSVLFEVNDVERAADGRYDSPATAALRALGYRLYTIEAGTGGAVLEELADGADPRPHAEPWSAPNLVAVPFARDGD